MKSDGPKRPPPVDDLTARAINRLGGWPKVGGGAKRRLADALSFRRLVKGFVAHKDSGFYMRDDLPKLKGLRLIVPSGRLTWPPEDFEKSGLIGESGSAQSGTCPNLRARSVRSIASIEVMPISWAKSMSCAVGKTPR